MFGSFKIAASIVAVNSGRGTTNIIIAKYARKEIDMNYTDFDFGGDYIVKLYTDMIKNDMKLRAERDPYLQKFHDEHEIDVEIKFIIRKKGGA